ncbi:MAG: xanthine dehydrogenase family protein subunit M [Alphaproteobacteria bacterium]
MLYHQPNSLDEALRLLAEIEGARCIAGGQTLVAMLNAKLVEPEALISLARIVPLSTISTVENGALRIGSMATHAAVATSPIVVRDFPMLAQTAHAIAHPAIRNFGTIGGAVAHGDPSADYPAALVASDAVIEIASTVGRRQVAVAEFFQDYLTTVLEPGELIASITVPRPPKNTTGSYYKLARVDGDYATVSVAAQLGVQGGKCSHIAVAIGSAGPRPVRLPAAEAKLIGQPLSDQAIGALGAALAEASDPIDDVRGSSDYRRAMISPLVRRVVSMLVRRLEGAS